MERRVSQILSESDRERHALEARLTPAERLAAAFELSMELRELFWAGLRAQGFSEEEIAVLYLARTR